MKPKMDEAERWLLRQLGLVTRQRLEVLAKRIEGGHPTSPVPGAELHRELIRKHAEAAYAWGAHHAQRELSAISRRQRFADPPTPAGPLPTEAIIWAQNRAGTQGKWERDLDEKVQEVIATSLEQGLTRRDIVKRLAQVFPEFSRHRLENIARTETASAYNAGRIATFKQSKFVAAVQFTAAIDDRTTDICRARDGRIILMDDPILAENLPPLHYMCRSTVVPVDKYDLQDLREGVAEVEERYFGWLEGREGAPRNLKEALDWSKAPQPLPGFSGTPAKATTQPPAPAVGPPPAVSMKAFEDVGGTGANEEVVERWKEFFQGRPPSDFFRFVNPEEIKSLQFETEKIGVRFKLKTDRYELDRTFFNEVERQGVIIKLVEHGAFVVEEKHQGQGIGKYILAANVRSYIDVGVDRIELNAGLEAGGYAWARFGFRAEDGNALFGQVWKKARKLPEAEANEAKEILLKLDPEEEDYARTVALLPWGEKLLAGTKWTGFFNLRDAVQLRYFWDYVNG